MKNKVIILIILGGFILLSFVIYKSYSRKDVLEKDPSVISTSTEIIYNNTEYGFNFSLPESWEGYTIVKNTWTGNSLKDETRIETGSKLLIRNPQWSEVVQYQDIPIIVFTTAQWNSYIAEDFSISAAPFLASELGRNNKYVFALPPRWDFDYNKGYEEAQSILKTKPLKPYVGVASENIGHPLFVWRYVKASTFNLDGQPKTNIFIDVTYPDGKVESKLIATTDGGCNDLPDSNEDQVVNSTLTQCYYAGLGYRFKIIKGPESYLVMQKSFEEGLPNETPGTDTYKVVSKFAY